MNDRLAFHVKSLGKIDWTAALEPPYPVNEYMESLVKESVTLHKVLSRYLPEPPVEVCHCLLSSCFSDTKGCIVCHDSSLCCHQPSIGGGVWED
jgi:hypothetical protein